jgi:hypothetical protein
VNPLLTLTAANKHIGHAFVVDLVAIGIIAFGVYYRRNRRSDLALAYVALNVSLFCVATMIVSETKVGVAFGFGLFAILSIIRLRSEPIAPEESAYYFVALVLGLINGMQFHNAQLALLLSLGLVVVMVLLDNALVMPRARRQVVTLDMVYPNEAQMRVDLEARLGCKVKRLFVKETDYVRDTTLVDVRYVPVTRPPRRSRLRVERDAHEVIA